MRKKELISIIVPIYNVEEYLEKCIESIIKQTYENLEIILVDDGSTDNSGKICDIYAKKDERIKTIHRENSGVSVTRNIGLENCNGEYIGFVDPDDYISPTMYEILYDTLKRNNADISMCSYQCFDSEKIEFTKSNNEISYNKNEALKELILDKDITSHLWNKLYKKDLFNEVSFPINKIYEDVGTIYFVLEKANLIIYNKSIQYAYFQRSTSLCNSISEKKMNNYIEMIDDRYKYLKSNFKELEEILNISRIQSSLIFNYIVAKDKNKELFNSQLLVNDYNKNIKIKFNLVKYMKLKYIMALIILKINRNLFYKIFSR